MTEIIRRELSNLQDLKYRDFQARLIPNIDPGTVVGVRAPALKNYAKSLKNVDLSAFLADLPHKYFEENNLHGLVIMDIPDYAACVRALDRFLPHVDNWATCDMLRPVSFKKNRAKLIEDIKRWLGAEHEYTRRFAIEMLMVHFLEEDFSEIQHKMVAEIKSEKYYVNMMMAWYFATALAKQWEATVSYIENCRLDKWVHNKSIQKALESYRITDEQKAYLKGLRMK